MGRRKGNSTFPVARIKKMMQSDDDVGKIATVTPVLVAKALECMMEYVLQEAARVALDKSTKTVTPQHLKTCVMQNDSFDFLRHVLGAVPEGGQKKRSRSPTSAPTKRRRRARADRNTDSSNPTTDNPADSLASFPTGNPSDSAMSLALQSASMLDVVTSTTKPIDDDDDEDYDDDEEESGSKGAADRVSVQALVS